MIIEGFYNVFDENKEEIVYSCELDDEFHYFEVGGRKVNVPKGTPGSSTSPVGKTENNTSLTNLPELYTKPKGQNPARMGTEEFQKWLETASPSVLEDFALSEDTGIFNSFYENDLEECSRNLHKAVLSHKLPFFKRGKVRRILREFRNFVRVLTEVYLELGPEGAMYFLLKNSPSVVESAELLKRHEVKDLLKEEWSNVSSTISVLQDLYLSIERSDSALDPRSLSF